MHKSLKLSKFEDVGFKFDNTFFKIPAQKYSNETFLVSNLTLQLEKFESIDFKYDNAFSKLRKAFLVPNLKIFTFAQNIKIRKIQGC